MSRSDGLPLDGDLDELAGRVQARTVNFDNFRFTTPVGVDPADVLVDRDGNKILSGATEKHHINPTELYTTDSLLGRLAEREIDGDVLYDHRLLETTGLPVCHGALTTVDGEVL